jgi:hypothetical protein
VELHLLLLVVRLGHLLGLLDQFLALVYSTLEGLLYRFIASLDGDLVLALGLLEVLLGLVHGLRLGLLLLGAVVG